MPWVRRSELERMQRELEQWPEVFARRVLRERRNLKDLEDRFNALQAEYQALERMKEA